MRQQVSGGLVGAEVGEVVGAEGGQGVALQRSGVLGGGVEEHLVAGVGGDALAQVAGELGEVLVGEHHGQAVAAGLGEHVLQRVGEGQEVVGLVDVEGGVDPVAFQSAGAGGGGLPGLGDNERTEQPSGLLAQRALRQAGQQDAAVQDIGQVKGGLAGGDGLAGERAQQEGTQLVHDRSDDGCARGLGQRLVPEPEAFEDGVLDGGDHANAVGGLAQEAGDVGEGDQAVGGLGVTQEGEACGAHDVVGARSPEGAEDAAEDAGDVVDDDVDVRAVQDVETGRGVGVVGVDDHQLVGA